MKRKLKQNTISAQPKRKKQKLEIKKEIVPKNSNNNNNSIYSSLPSLLCNIHTMKLFYASNLDKSKYDKCPKCLELNNYETMHFIFVCNFCKYFVCNFCMSDLYVSDQLKRSPINIINNMKADKKRNKSSNAKKVKKKSKSNKKQKKTTKNRYNPEKKNYNNHTFKANPVDEEGAIATRTRNGMRNKKNNGSQKCFNQ